MSGLGEWNKKGFAEVGGKLVKLATSKPISPVREKGKKVDKIKPEIGFIGGFDPYGAKSDLVLATGFAMIGKTVAKYEGRPNVAFPDLIEEMKEISKYYDCKIQHEVRRVKIDIKPLTVNRAWKGQRFKTTEYKKYHEAVLLLLPNDLVVPDGLLKVSYEFGMSKNSDVDNPCKLFTDILQAKYKFNDSRIMELHIRKTIVKKGGEFIRFSIEAI